MQANTISQVGDSLYQAWRSRSVMPALRETYTDITVEDAYAIQKRFIDNRVQAGESIIGKKIGVTSKPVQDFLGVFEPDFGQLTSSMLCTEKDGVNLNELIQPKAEAELAFVLERDLEGPGITAADVIRATAYVSPCFEIVDSRIKDWNIKIQDTVADNASCGVFLLGEAKGDPRKIDITMAGMVLHKNGDQLATSMGAAVQASPINAVVWLANTLGRLGLPFRAGEIILSGSQSQLVPVVDGDVLRCEVGGLGVCETRFHGRSAA
ncbi:fumarylacetoacetate hydrolase family protein [Hydrogenophaga sp. 5NK40-0174]|uniref:fumarylacetoacetate hydrolase family protein n=1 Tax=Hydrogenophaga sp. 5NK40-0174 TaxID=3127649 RepID=UPI003342AC4E